MVLSGGITSREAGEPPTTFASKWRVATSWVTLPGTRYAVTYCKPTNSRQLQGKHFPEHVDRRSPISQAAFVGKAWKLATDKARELGWIV